MTKAFPLQWPTGKPRSKKQVDSSFRVQPTQAYEEMVKELSRFDAKNVVISTNIPLRRDGTPYRDGMSDLLDDAGVAVYFSKSKRSICLPCDTYRRVWENCRAIGKAVDALRSMERHGAHQILDQAFQGFMALPAPDADTANNTPREWWEILGVSPKASTSQIRQAHKDKCRQNGGATADLNIAKELGLRMVDL